MKNISILLPVELMIEILHKMSINTLVRCTSVCKYWNSLIKDPAFISTHLKLTTMASSFALCRLHYSDPRYEHEQGTKECYYIYHDNQDFSVHKVIDFPFKGHKKSFRVVDSINGLVCLIRDHDYILYCYLLWNPSIQKYITLPRPNLTSKCHAFVGFGYDSRNDDHKLVRMVPPNGPKGLNSRAQLEIFSLKSSSWKTLSGQICHKYMTIASSSQAFVNGVVHWIARREGDSSLNYVLLGLDMSNEVLHEIILPEEFRIQLLVCPLVYKDSTIGLYYRDPSIGNPCLWIMKEYGVRNSWTKIFVAGNDLTSMHTARPLWIKRKGEELIAESLDGDLIAVDLQNRHVKYRQVLGTPGRTFIGSYVESLVLLDT